MSDVGQNERATQNRIIKLISNKLDYKNLVTTILNRVISE